MERIIESMDVKLSQVLIETVIIEVQLDDTLKTGIDWVQRGRQTSYRQASDQYGRPLFWGTDDNGNVVKTIENTGYKVMEAFLDRDGFVNHGSYGLGGGGGGLGGGGSILSSVMNAVSDSSSGESSSTGSSAAYASASAAANTFFGSANPIGSGINYILKSDKLNLAAVIQATKTDMRAKYIASPVVMTVDNKEATVDATENRQFLTGWNPGYASSSGNVTGQPSPSYSSKDIGIKLKITPKINPNGTVMLEVEEEYSQFVEDGQAMLIPQGSTYRPGKVDLAVERKMSADILLENMQTVVLGGLIETHKSESETGIPILKDIPWIGKWLFGSVSQHEDRKELLVFMTPYVLDDGEAAQVEALRRKKALSDSKPWEDHGWSLSELADPVSKREQLRRLKDEWKRQDEERKTKLAIEEEKIKRAKALEKMSEDERNHWLEMHKDELEKEKRKELEKMMQDEESQEELKKIAAGVRERKLSEANAAIDKTDREQRAENERGRIEAEKKSREEATKPEEEAKAPVQEAK